MKSSSTLAILCFVLPFTLSVHAGEMKSMDMDRKAMSQDAAAGKTHKAVGVVVKVDRKDGTVTLAHEPVKSMNWPAMTMVFLVRDKTMLDKLAIGRKAEFEFASQGKNYVITGAK